ncbi:MAG: hypothetical protein H6667_18270 [Ardenticatenaceae bacterium]|nr:hypothetical protein [Ardenticatenaceae bacterium]
MLMQISRRAYGVSWIVVGGTAVASVIGLLYPDHLYPTAELRQSYLTNDVINLIIGLSIILIAIWLAWRGRLLGLLLWPGAMLYGLYNYIAYVVGLPFGWSTLLYLVIVLGSGLAIFDVLKSIDVQPVAARLADAVPVKTSGWILLLFGLLFFLRAVSMVADAVVARTGLPVSEQGVVIADILISPLWMAGGMLLLRRKPWGYVGGLGLLFAASMLFIGLIGLLLLQPFFTEAAFALTDVLVVAAMGLICFVPFALFARGVAKSEM